MDKNLKDALEKTNGQDYMEQFLSILELEDSKFDVVYPKLKEQMIQTFDSKLVKKQIAEQMAESPDFNITNELEDLKGVIGGIEDDDSLSKNKKDLLITLISKAGETVQSILANPRERIKVKVVRVNKDAILPTYAHELDAGADVYSVEDVEIAPNTTVVVKTGLQVAIPAGYQIEIRPRSGMSLKTPLRIANSVGTIDSGFRGEVGIIMNNIGDTPQTIKKGDRIAQMLISPTPMIEWVEADKLNSTDRTGGYGSTGR